MNDAGVGDGLERMAARLTELGYEHRFTRFLGYEHFSQALVDEWADGAAYLSQHEVDPNPREVTYAVVPVLTWALNHVDPPAGAEFDFRPDGAYWIDEVVARDVEVKDEATGRPADDANALVQAVSEAIPAPAEAPVVDTGVASPPGHSTPYVRSGLRHEPLPDGLLSEPFAANRLTLDLANVAHVSADVERAHLDLDTPAEVAITTDGPTTVRLVGAAPAGTTWTADGATLDRDGEDLMVTITEPTTTRVHLDPGT